MPITYMLHLLSVFIPGKRDFHTIWFLSSNWAQVSAILIRQTTLELSILLAVYWTLHGGPSNEEIPGTIYVYAIRMYIKKIMYQILMRYIAIQPKNNNCELFYSFGIGFV